MAFFTSTIVENITMLTYINRVKPHASNLKSMNIKLDDHDLAMGTLSNLPQKSGSLMSALDASVHDPDVFTLKFIKGHLLQEGRRSIMRGGNVQTKSEACARFAERSSRDSCYDISSL